MADIEIGDVLTFGKGGAGVPDELAEDKYFRVEAIEDGTNGIVGWKLSRPYSDIACTIPYRMKPPKRLRGEILKP